MPGKVAAVKDLQELVVCSGQFLGPACVSVLLLVLAEDAGAGADAGASCEGGASMVTVAVVGAMNALQRDLQPLFWLEVQSKFIQVMFREIF